MTGDTEILDCGRFSLVYVVLMDTKSWIPMHVREPLVSFKNRTKTYQSRQNNVGKFLLHFVLV